MARKTTRDLSGSFLTADASRQSVSGSKVNEKLPSRGEKQERVSFLTKSAKKPSRPRPKLPRVSDEIKRLAALLEAEVLDWSSVKSRPMFGLNGLYRGRKIFAVLPRTRAMDAPDSISFRLPKRSHRITAQLRKDERIVAPTPDAKWISFVIHSDADIHDALNWLALAYREAAKKH